MKAWPAARSVGYAALAALFGARLPSRVERRLTGANAVTRRALIAHRSAMALARHHHNATPR